MELAICGIVYGVKKMMIFVVLAIVFAVLSVFLYKAEHNFRADGFCEGTISRIILEDSGDMRYYIKAYINGIEREGETYTYEKSPKKTYVGQKVKVEYFCGKNGFIRFCIMENGFVKRTTKGAYMLLGGLSLASLITFLVMCIVM